MTKTLFLCFGLPKSGTTLLQRSLDLHPDVSCPSEQAFTPLWNSLTDLGRGYEDLLRVVDRRTGGQGARVPDGKVWLRVMATAVREIILDAAGAKPIAGANDNGVLENLGFYQSLLDRPKMICILRHPVEMALSAWHHNLYLAEVEGDVEHRDMMLTHGGQDGWIRYCARIFDAAVQGLQAFAAQGGDVLVLRYEDLLRDREGQLKRAFDYLGAPVDAAAVATIIAETQVDKMRAEAEDPAFFRRGGEGLWSSEVPVETWQAVEALAGNSLRVMKYAFPSS